MKEIKSFETFVSEKKSDKWIAGAIEKPGSLKAQLHMGKKETLTKGKIEGELSKLKKKDKDKSEPGVQGLSKPDLKKFRRLNLAKTLMGLGEGHNEHDNYMFFANVKNIHRMCQEILEMDHHKVDHILSDGHGWAVDHVATSKDDVEEVYNFLKSSCEEYKDQEEIMISGVDELEIEP
jgi:hypothetical protein